MKLKFFYLIFIISSCFSANVIAQNSANPYREFVEKELKRNLTDTVMSQERYVYKMNIFNIVDCDLGIKILPQTILNSIKGEYATYQNNIYNGNIGVLWLPWVSYIKQYREKKQYRLIACDVSETIFLAKTSSDTVANFIIDNKVVEAGRHLLIKAIPLKDRDEPINDEKLMSREKGILLNYVSDTTKQQIKQDLQKYCNSNNAILNKLIEARYCEVNGYLANAIGLYQEVLQQEPNNLQYRKLYVDFLRATRMIVNGYH